MTPSLLIALPRLHRELALAAVNGAALPDGVAILWPGLPRADGKDGLVYTPEYPWPPALAAACVADFERLAREGAKGSPVLALFQDAMMKPADGLSQAERQALADWKREHGGVAPETAPTTVSDGNTKEEAQRVLLLAWLREKQVLELRDLEGRVIRNRNVLDSCLGEGLPVGEDGLAPSGRPELRPEDMALPSWKTVLDAASVFLPPEAAVAVTDKDMAEAVLSLAAAMGTSAEPAAPEGWTAFSLSPSRLSGRPSLEDGAERTMIFVCPETRVRS